MYYSNSNSEEFNRFVEFLGFNSAASISEAKYVFIDLEKFIFADQANQKMNFSSHNLSARELNDKFNRLLQHFAIFEQQNPQQKQYRVLVFDLIDVESNYDEDLFRWSYYNHRFAASQGQDADAMDEWHRLEQKLDVNQIAQFKARRENTLAHYMHVLQNHRFFDEILISAINPRIHHETKYGLDIAEQEYLTKLIKEQKASKVVRIVDHKMTNIVLNLLKQSLIVKEIKLKGHLISNSKKMNPYLLMMLRNMFSYLNIQETAIENCDFAFLVNDLDLLSSIPIVDTDKPIFAVDLSAASTPNFSYLLLKDDGFDQVFSYAKLRAGEKPLDTFIRSFVAGLSYFVSDKRFVEQMAINYMDDYFTQLVSSLNKSLKDFEGPIAMLTNKLK